MELNMKWLIKPIKVEIQKTKLLMQMLECADIPFDIVHTIDGVMYDNNKEKYVLKPEEKYFVCGSYQLARAVAVTHPEACFTIEQYSFDDWYGIFGRENMLNGYAQICKPQDIQWHNEEMFVRPLFDTKSFNGGIYNKTTLVTDVDCLVAPIQHIQKEFRFFVLDGKIIGKSQYKMAGNLFPSSIVDEDAILFAQKMIQKFKYPGYVIDIATTDGQCKIVELNCFNASGFYEIDLWKFIDSVTNYFDGL